MDSIFNKPQTLECTNSSNSNCLGEGWFLKNNIICLSTIYDNISTTFQFLILKAHLFTKQFSHFSFIRSSL